MAQLDRNQIRAAQRMIENQRLAEKVAKTLSGSEKARMQLLAIYSNLKAHEIVAGTENPSA